MQDVCNDTSCLFDILVALKLRLFVTTPTDSHREIESMADIKCEQLS